MAGRGGQQRAGVWAWRAAAASSPPTQGWATRTGRDGFIDADNATTSADGSTRGPAEVQAPAAPCVSAAPRVTGTSWARFASGAGAGR